MVSFGLVAGSETRILILENFSGFRTRPGKKVPDPIGIRIHSTDDKFVHYFYGTAGLSLFSISLGAQD